jgi:arylsulfatase A-like enzyme
MLCYLVALFAVARASAPPNFLLLFPDQWRHDWTPASLAALRMPVFAALVANGTSFRQAYVPSPLCAPSRAALASGREYDDCGVPDNFSVDYPINQTTFYSLLQAAGYHVMSAGKDDLTKATGPGLNGSFHARELGFSDFARNMGKEDCTASAQPRDPYGAYCAARSVDVGGKNESLWAVLKGDVAHCCVAGAPAPGGYVCPTGSLMPQASYCDDWVTANALTLLARKPAGMPWLMQVSFSGPHPPFVVTPPMYNSTRDRSWPPPVDNVLLPAASAHAMRADYASELEHLDALFGRILEALGSEANNTYIIIYSDHGEMMGDHDDYSKSQPWQGSASVPLLVSAPALGVPSGATVDAAVATIDVTGTILDFAAVAPAPSMAGLSSLRPFLQATPAAGAGGAAYRPFVSSGLANWRMVVAARNGTDYKLICCRGACPGQPRNSSRTGGGRAPYDGDAAPAPAPAAAPPADTRLLYAPRADPFDMDDLATTLPAVVSALTPFLPPGWCAA